MNQVQEIDAFNEHRGLLFGIAWRMLGNAADADDILQEALIRWQKQSAAEVRSLRAFLVTMVTRLCLNHLDLARVKNELSMGTSVSLENLPSAAFAPANDDDLAEALDSAFSIVLQCLSPIERAVFLLREVFDRDYAEISRIVEKSEENCRQILRRARERIAGQEPRFKVSLREQEIAMEEFLNAATSGDLKRLTHLLTEEVSLVRDGDNLGAAAPPALRGREAVAGLLAGEGMSLFLGNAQVRFGLKNVPFILSYDGTELRTALAVLLDKGLVRSIYQITCPVRLRSICGEFRQAEAQL